MAKKSVKSAKIAISKKPVSISKRLDKIDAQLSQIITSQKKLLHEEQKIESEELKLEAEEKKIETLENKELVDENQVMADEKKEVRELKKIEALQNQLRNEIKTSPLKKVTYKDVTKGMIGAFFGVVGHFAFVKGVELANHIDTWRASLILASSFGIMVAFLYFAGFRAIDDEVKYKYLPIRAIVIFLSAIITSVIVLAIYGEIGTHTTFTELYRTIASMSILAVLGAATADLLGKDNAE